jgi:hypothetical protein
MPFCSKCENLYDIANQSAATLPTQEGGKNNTDKTVDAIKNLVKKTTKNPTNVIFICRKCGNNEEIKPGTLIMSDHISTGSEHYNMQNMIYSRILPYTRKYTCPNQKCQTHKDESLKEAKMFRVGSTFRVRLICMHCKHSWFDR